MTDLTEAARATRKWQCTPGNVVYSLSTDGVRVCSTQEAAQAACDRMNLLAVLEALREPSERMLRASDRFAHTDETENIDWKGIARVQWRAMIDAAIAEVRQKL